MVEIRNRFKDIVLKDMSNNSHEKNKELQVDCGRCLHYIDQNSQLQLELERKYSQLHEANMAKEFAEKNAEKLQQDNEELVEQVAKF